jgi:hypothetical protein
MRELLTMLDGEPENPNPEFWFKNLPDLLLDHNQFVASSFASHLPAWQEMLRNSSRKLAKSVPDWLEKGFKPKFVGQQRKAPEEGGC